MAHSSDADGWAFLFFLGGIVLWAVWDTEWFGKLWYATANKVKYEDVLITLKPHDCEFGTAPMGRKNCHYKAQVIVFNDAPKEIEVDWIKVAD